jgi:hypothetical protein
LYAAGAVSEALWYKLWAGWQDRRNQIKRTLDTLALEQDSHINNLNAALEIISMIGTVYNGLERADQKDLLRQIVERVVVDVEGNVRFVLRSPLRTSVSYAISWARSGNLRDAGKEKAAEQCLPLRVETV